MPTVAIAGMFDLDNYGDLLFPLIARDRLAPVGFDVRPVAPTATQSVLADVMPPLALDEALADMTPFAGLLIGGGYLIHLLPIEFADQYSAAGIAGWGGAGLWLGATIAAAIGDMPVMWNAPGVLQPLRGRTGAIAGAALRATDYVAVRDRGAAELLGAPDDVAVSVVPDPVTDLARMWPRDTLAPDFRRLLARKDFVGDERFLAIHLRDRAVAGIGMAEIGAAVDAAAARLGLIPLLIAVGRSHDDPATMRALSRALGRRHLLLDDPASLREITASLAHAACYLGASLHGYVAAASYGVPGVLVARPAYRKFLGYLEHLGTETDLAHGWDEAFAKLDDRARPGQRAVIPARCREALDGHWAAIARCLAAPSPRRAARDRLLAAVVAGAFASGRGGDLLQPFLARLPRLAAEMPVAA